jgi:hypothetical protein
MILRKFRYERYGHIVYYKVNMICYRLKFERIYILEIWSLCIEWYVIIYLVL